MRPLPDAIGVYSHDLQEYYPPGSAEAKAIVKKILLKRQAAWQRTRAKLSWSEKINTAARIRNDIILLRKDSGIRRLKPAESSK
ncbi:MAG: hypothetical protein JXN60_02595 [Lentisphaerae bacterium]|nr:hypothetical protein [Lentisphaerota bacterium]